MCLHVPSFSRILVFAFLHSRYGGCFAVYSYYVIEVAYHTKICKYTSFEDPPLSGILLIASQINVRDVAIAACGNF
jgi:hypothetical protein